jgi:hypothetical protein
LTSFSRFLPVLRGFGSNCNFSNTLRSRGGTILRFAVLAAATVPAAFGQQPIGQLPTGEAILGFEDTTGWQVSVGAPTAVTLSTVRTQGTYAYSVMNPGNQSRLNSLPVPSTAAPLAGLGAPNSTFAVDIRFPASGNGGSLRLSINSPSKGLNNLPLGKVAFGQLRPNTFQTISFPIPDQARKALAGAPFNDLTFQLDMSVPGGSGEYLFDNLRVRSTQVVMTDATTKPPLGYGGSVDLDLNVPTAPVGTVPAAQTSVEQTFEVGPIQIPDRFHVKWGMAGAGTSVQLDLGYSSTSLAVTCVYLPDTLDTTSKSYLFSSCTGGPQPGDIISATWVRLTIINGDPGMRILAQLARRPVGDQMGSGIIPPMPTFWGDADTCIPAPVSGQVATLSQSCSDTVLQASKIVTDYFNAVTQGNPSIGWVVAPVPDFAKRNGDGTPLSSISGVAHANAPLSLLSINKEGHASHPGATFDAYWKLTGGLNYTIFPDSDHALTHLDADFSTHGVFLGEDVTVLDVSAFADSDSGQAYPTPLPATAHAEAHLYLFGLEYPVGGFKSDPSGDFNTNVPVFSAPLPDFSIHFWIFAIKVGVRANAGLGLSGSVSPTGMNLTATPEGTIGAHLFGGIDVVVASGGVDVKVDLLAVKIPVGAQAKWLLDTSLISCSANITGSVDSDLTISSGGGHVDLVATLGICPVCDDESETLFSWEPLYEKTIPVFHESLDLASFPLPTTLCTGKDLNVLIDAFPDPSSPGGPVPLVGTATSLNTINLGTTVACDDNSTWVWSVDTASLDQIGGDKCHPNITFGSTEHTANITLKVTHTVTLSDGRTLSESGTGTRAVHVKPLPTGLDIDSVYNVTTGTFQTIPQTGSPEPRLTSTTGPAPDGYILTATPVGIDISNAKIVWTLTDTHGSTTDLTCYPQEGSPSCVGITQDNPDGDPFSVGWSPDGSLGVWTITVQAIDKTTNAVISTGILQANFFLGPQ